MNNYNNNYNNNNNDENNIKEKKKKKKRSKKKPPTSFGRLNNNIQMFKIGYRCIIKKKHVWCLIVSIPDICSLSDYEYGIP